MGIRAWSDCMWQTVTVQPFSTRDSHGKPSYGTSVVVENSRVVYKSFWFRKPDGSEVQAKGIVWLGSSMRVSVEDKLVLPDGTAYPVLQAETYPDEKELSHTKVILG